MKVRATRDAVAARAPWNALLRVAGAFGYRGAHADALTLVRRASAATGLDDFGEPSFRAPLDLLATEFAQHEGVDPAGRQVFASLIGCALENRLRVRHLLRTYPDVADVPVVAPVFVVGLPRTGTTLLQGLLASVPGMRTLQGWEARLPALPPGVASRRLLARHRRRVASDMRYARLLSPRLMASHAFGAELPEECNPLLMSSLRGLATGLFPCPRHEDLLYGSGFRGTYDFHRPHLQLLSYRQSPCTWVLKAPAHMASLPELLRCYPDARVVFLHRDPAAAVPSTAGLVECLDMLLTPVRDRQAIGRRVLAMLQRMHAAARAARGAWPASAPSYLDVAYDTLVEAPLATVRTVLAHFDIPEPAGTGDAVRRYLRTSHRTRLPSPRYACATYGFSEEDARAAVPAFAGAHGAPRP